jgi:hypothetical protein
MAFFQWSRTGDTWQGLLAIGLAVACPMLKNEGLFWSLTLLVGLGAVTLPRTWLLGLTAFGCLLLLAIMSAFPRHLELAGHVLASLDLGLRPDALVPLLRSLFVLDSWHLLFWMIAALVVARAIVARRCRLPWPKSLSSLGMSLASAVLLLFLLFVTTNYAHGAVWLTTASRITLHLAPALLFFAMLLWHDLATSGSIRAMRKEPARGDTTGGRLRPR